MTEDDDESDSSSQEESSMSGDESDDKFKKVNYRIQQILKTLQKDYLTQSQVRKVLDGFKQDLCMEVAAIVDQEQSKKTKEYLSQKLKK